MYTEFQMSSSTKAWHFFGEINLSGWSTGIDPRLLGDGSLQQYQQQQATRIKIKAKILTDADRLLSHRYWRLCVAEPSIRGLKGHISGSGKCNKLHTKQGVEVRNSGPTMQRCVWVSECVRRVQRPIRHVVDLGDKSFCWIALVVTSSKLKTTERERDR